MICSGKLEINVCFLLPPRPAFCLLSFMQIMSAEKKKYSTRLSEDAIARRLSVSPQPQPQLEQSKGIKESLPRGAAEKKKTGSVDDRQENERKRRMRASSVSCLLGFFLLCVSPKTAQEEKVKRYLHGKNVGGRHLSEQIAVCMRVRFSPSAVERNIHGATGVRGQMDGSCLGQIHQTCFRIAKRKKKRGSFPFFWSFFLFFSGKDGSAPVLATTDMRTRGSLPFPWRTSTSA
mmetsp:Transcript_12335/g.23920  ORF Transcript_12335/g.23920 Transcript_12335/m.23920 type:complete len:233 (-) Transcript_12335:284-982(-)